MLYSNREYFSSTQPIKENLKSQAMEFVADNEEIIYTFDGGDIAAFFTNKKIIFVSNIKSKFFETELLPYSSISRFNVIGSSDTKYGRMDIIITDDILISFLLNEYKEALSLCKKILLYI